VSGETEPRRIGDYEVVAKLADGGVGTVYLARRRGPAGFSRLVAIKRLHPQFATAPSFVTMFTDEARLAARIHHANVVSIVELGTDADGGYYVVMEYVEGSNLGHLSWHAAKAHGGRPMARAVALRVVLDALSGLHAAHEVEDDDGTIVNLVHRDVSPQNILIGIDGLARLGDFGIARASALRVFETRGAAVKGKLEYMAPEQVESKEVDRTTDLFAMGIVLWELLTGRRLFQAANQVTTIQRVCFDPIPSARSVEQTVSPELDRICAKALERPRVRRYPTAAAFAEELEVAARADAGVATQREVATFLSEILGPSLQTARDIMRRSARSDAPRAMPDLAAGSPGNASTQQLPPSDPMIRLPESASSGEPPITMHYDERLPAEVLAEAGMRAPRSSSDRTMAMVDRPGMFSPPSAAPPASLPRSAAPVRPSAPPPMTSASAARPSWTAVIAILALGMLLGVGVAAFVMTRLAQHHGATMPRPASSVDELP
jgi:serine/threonine-protein kinase